MGDILNFVKPDEQDNLYDEAKKRWAFYSECQQCQTALHITSIKVSLDAKEGMRLFVLTVPDFCPVCCKDKQKS